MQDQQKVVFTGCVGVVITEDQMNGTNKKKHV